MKRDHAIFDVVSKTQGGVCSRYSRTLANLPRRINIYIALAHSNLIHLCRPSLPILLSFFSNALKILNSEWLHAAYPAYY